MITNITSIMIHYHPLFFWSGSKGHGKAGGGDCYDWHLVHGLLMSRLCCKCHSVTLSSSLLSLLSSSLFIILMTLRLEQYKWWCWRDFLWLFPPAQDWKCQHRFSKDYKEKYTLCCVFLSFQLAKDWKLNFSFLVLFLNLSVMRFCSNLKISNGDLTCAWQFSDSAK